MAKLIAIEWCWVGACGGHAGACGAMGILGLGYAALALPHTDAFMDRVAVTAGGHTASETRKQQADLFAVKLCRDHGHLWLGGFNAAAAQVAAEPVYTPLIDHTYYVVRLVGMGVGAVPLPDTVVRHPSGVTNGIVDRAMVDTGTTRLALPPAVLAAVAAVLERHGVFRAQFGLGFFYRMRCVSAPAYTAAQLNAALPSLRITLEGITLELAPVSSYLQEMVSDGATYFCPGIGPTTSGAYILGWSVLNQYLTIFDRARSRIGFAPLLPLACDEHPSKTKARGR
jgi:hypothetical protein